MISQKHLALVFITYALIVFKMITGFPVNNSCLSNKNDPFEGRNETRYPNGTVVGELSYMDEEGNPINVKYYADEFNYGVELKSSKITGPSKTTFWKASSFGTVEKSDDQQTTGKINRAQNKKKMEFKNEKKPAEYETFYRNDIKGLNQCDTNKVRVYLDKEKNIIKRALEKYHAAKSCERY